MQLEMQRIIVLLMLLDVHGRRWNYGCYLLKLRRDFFSRKHGGCFVILRIGIGVTMYDAIVASCLGATCCERGFAQQSHIKNI